MQQPFLFLIHKCNEFVTFIRLLCYFSDLFIKFGLIFGFITLLKAF